MVTPESTELLDTISRASDAKRWDLIDSKKKAPWLLLFMEAPMCHERVIALSARLLLLTQAHDKALWSSAAF